MNPPRLVPDVDRETLRARDTLVVRRSPGPFDVTADPQDTDEVRAIRSDQPARLTKGWIDAADGTPLFVRRYEPEDGPARGTLLVLHGASEHGGWYDHVARFLVARRWSVVVPDHRGHGRSGGPALHVDRFDRYVDDVETVRVRFALDPRRTVVAGHSMGGLLATRTVQTRPASAAGLVLLSPLFGLQVPIPATTLFAGRILSVVWPSFRFRSRVDVEFTCHDPVVRRLRREDPLDHESVTAGWFFAMRAAIDEAWAAAGSMSLPLRVVQAGDDRIVDPQATRDWFARCGSADKEFESLAGHRHELHNEPDWRDTLTRLVAWLDARID
jgi:lysophospholipase